MNAYDRMPTIPAVRRIFYEPKFLKNRPGEDPLAMLFIHWGRHHERRSLATFKGTTYRDIYRQMATWIRTARAKPCKEHAG